MLIVSQSIILLNGLISQTLEISAPAFQSFHTVDRLSGHGHRAMVFGFFLTYQGIGCPAEPSDWPSVTVTGGMLPRLSL